MNRRLVIHKVYQEEQGKPLDWEDGGCLRFPGLVAKALTGRDPTEKYRGKFKSEASAKKFLSKNGRKAMASLIEEEYEPIPVAQARAGDWAIIKNEDGTDTLGVVIGSMVAAMTKEGISATVPLDKAKIAYRVE